MILCSKVKGRWAHLATEMSPASWLPSLPGYDLTEAGFRGGRPVLDADLSLFYLVALGKSCPS